MTTSNSAPTYTLSSKNNGNDYQHRKQKVQHNLRRRTHSEDDAESMTYSVNSSSQNSGSSAGESTDSSFADIMRVLDLQETKDIKNYIKKDAAPSAAEKRSLPALEVSESSLNYSMEGESFLGSSELLQTIAGQPSDSAYGDGYGRGDLMFAPAAVPDVKKKRRNDRTIGERSSIAADSTPKAKNSLRKTRYEASPTGSVDTPTKSPPRSASKPGTPPLPSKQYIDDNEEGIWYAKWWVACFPDTFKEMMPTR